MDTELLRRWRDQGQEDALPTYSTSKRSVELGGMTQDVGSHPLHPAPFSPYASSGGSFRLRFPPEI
jgi:hypothetical protein